MTPSEPDLPEVVSRSAWLVERKRLLARENELTRFRNEGPPRGEGRPICFLRDGDRVHHTCSTHARGIGHVGGTPAGSERLRYPEGYDE